MIDHDLSAQAREAGLNAWPALKQILLDSWLLRFADGLSRRANSVNPLAAGRRALPEKIALCEAHYRAQGLPTIFRLEGDIEPGLLMELAARGYRAEGESRVLYADLSRAGTVADVELATAPGTEWLAGLGELQGQDERQRRACRRILDLLAIPAAFAAIRGEGEIAAVAFAARHDRMASINAVVTGTRHRRQGLSRRVVGALLGWASDGGATGACVQVAADNAPALALYDGLGFDRELYCYHYQRRPAP
jgi:N-acetylglutamate synthase